MDGWKLEKWGSRGKCLVLFGVWERRGESGSFEAYLRQNKYKWTWNGWFQDLQTCKPCSAFGHLHVHAAATRVTSVADLGYKYTPSRSPQHWAPRPPFIPSPTPCYHRDQLDQHCQRPRNSAKFSKRRCAHPTALRSAIVVHGTNFGTSSFPDIKALGSDAADDNAVCCQRRQAGGMPAKTRLMSPKA